MRWKCRCDRPPFLLKNDKRQNLFSFRAKQQRFIPFLHERTGIQNNNLCGKQYERTMFARVWNVSMYYCYYDVFLYGKRNISIKWTLSSVFIGRDTGTKEKCHPQFSRDMNTRTDILKNSENDWRNDENKTSFFHFRSKDENEVYRSNVKTFDTWANNRFRVLLPLYSYAFI